MPLLSPTELTSATLIDLPITMDADGFMSIESLATSTADGADLAPVTNEKALEVLESTIDSAKLLKSTAALLSNKEIKDPLFQTWKMYKENTATKTIMSDPLFSIIQNENSESNILSLPNPIPRASKAASSRNKPETRYFVITADDAYNHKKQAHDSKKEKQQKKALKRVQRQTASKIKGKGKRGKIDETAGHCEN